MVKIQFLVSDLAHSLAFCATSQGTINGVDLQHGVNENENLIGEIRLMLIGCGVIDEVS